MSPRKSKEAERLLAEKYEAMARDAEAHMGDVSHWGPAIDVKVPKGGPLMSFALPISGAELDYLYDVAKEAGVTLDDFILNAALDAAKARSKRAKASSPRKD